MCCQLTELLFPCISNALVAHGLRSKDAKVQQSMNMTEEKPVLPLIMHLKEERGDLPLDPTQNLSMEDGNVSWDEGVGSMNSIMRFIFKKIFDVNRGNETLVYVSKICLFLTF